MSYTTELVKGNMYINGEWLGGQEQQILGVFNPANGDKVGTVAYGDDREAKLAINAASQALNEWKSFTAKQRGTILERISDIMIERKEELALTLTMEQGKPLNEAKGEILQGADFVKWYAEEGKRVYGSLIPPSSSSKRILTWQEPVGVTGAITPWNFPVAMVTRKLAPALAAGCTVVLKPAPETPLSAIKLFEIFEEAGLPAGVANLVIGDASSIGKEFLSNKAVKKISFTGSTEVGKKLYRESAEQMKRISLELGGHAPFIVFKDADLDLAIDGVIASKFRNAGQTCVCANRLYVHEDIAEEFAEKLVAKVKQMKVGSGLDTGTKIGPVINKDAMEKIDAHVVDAKQKGASVVCGGKSLESRQNGYFYEPTVLLDVKDDMLITNEETFGPVLGIGTFETDEEVVERANDTDYGLAAYFYTNNLQKSYTIAEKLEYGIIGLNDPGPAVAQAPFGGFKESGLGREGGTFGIQEFLEVKYLSVQL